MPLHLTGLASRRSILHPEPKPAPLPTPSFEQVLKANPYHDKEGYFTSKDKAHVGSGAAASGKHVGGGGGGSSAVDPEDLEDAQEELEDAQSYLKDADAKMQELNDEWHNLETAIRDNDGMDSKAVSRDTELRAELKAVQARVKAQEKEVADAMKYVATATKQLKSVSGGSGGGKVPAPKTKVSLNPDETSADKMLTHLKKEYGGEAGYHGSSNPYSKHQHRAAKLKPEQAKRLAQDLEAAGWKKHSGNVNEAYKHRVFNFDNKHDAGMRIDIEDGTVSIYGLKKAKPTSIPYYD